MKKTLLILVLAFLAVAGVAQVEYTYDFNGLNEGQQNLNGQDGWVTHYQTAGTSTWHIPATGFCRLTSQ